MQPSMENVIACAKAACRSFAKCSANFFNCESWLGWENWLTVDIVRRLDNPIVRPFHRYTKDAKKLDIYIDAPVDLAVEIKTNYITDLEAKKSPRPMSRRVLKDAEKIMSWGKDVDRLLLVSTCFDSTVALRAYPECIARDLKRRLGSFKCGGSIVHAVLARIRSWRYRFNVAVS